MTSVEALAADIRHGLALIATARAALAQGHGLIGEADPLWGHVVEGTNDPDAAQLPGLADTVAIGIGECHTAATQAEQLLLYSRAGPQCPRPPPAGARWSGRPFPCGPSRNASRAGALYLRTAGDSA